MDLSNVTLCLNLIISPWEQDILQVYNMDQYEDVRKHIPFISLFAYITYIRALQLRNKEYTRIDHIWSNKTLINIIHSLWEECDKVDLYHFINRNNIYPILYCTCRYPSGIIDLRPDPNERLGIKYETDAIPP